MNKINREALEEIIGKSKFLKEDNLLVSDEEIKQMLRKTVFALCDYNEEVMHSLNNKILSSVEEHAIGDIVCVVTNAEEKPDLPDFCEMYGCESDRNILFIDADYSEMCKIVGDYDTEKLYEAYYVENGSNKSFKYKFKFYDGYLKAQELLYKLSPYYELNNSVMYSPFSRKAFEIVFVDELPENFNIENINYRFEEQGIPVIENSVLLWNLVVEKTEAVFANEKVPYGDETKYKYIFNKTSEGNWLYALPQNNQTLIYDVRFTERGTEIYTDHELDEFILVEHRKINLDQLEIKKLDVNNRVFRNWIDRNAVKIRRIVSQSDIEYSIRPFRDYNGIKCEIVSELDKIATRYSYKYRNRMDNGLIFKKIGQVNLKFSPVEEYSFIEDYINYVLLFMGFHYPELEWVGGQ